MARIRSIHPGLFTDEAFASLSMAARVLLFGIWTEADDHGVFEWKPVTLKMRIMPVDAVDIPQLLSEIEAAGVIKAFTSGKSYGVVRNFCRYQRPKKPKYVHPMPAELRTYAGLNEDGSLQVLHQSRTGAEKSPQREEEGGDLEDEDEKKGESSDPPPKNFGVIEGGAVPIDETYDPSEPAIEYAYSLGMKKADLTSELSKFKATGAATRAVSFNLDMSFKVWCDRWLDHKRKHNPDFAPEPEAPSAPAEPYVVVVENTLEANCWAIYNRENGLRPLFFCKQILPSGAIAIGARTKALFPPGFDTVTGERIAPKSDEVAA